MISNQGGGQSPGLVVVMGLPEEILKQLSEGQLILEEVNPKQWASIDGNGYLCTLGASPCLNVVVHNASVPGHGGCVAHVFNYFIHQSNLYQTACNTILLMIKQASVNSQDVLDIWLGSGFAFYPGSIYVKQGLVNTPFPDYLLHSLKEQGVDLQRIRLNSTGMRTESRGVLGADGPDPGDILYVPAQRTIYVLNGANRALFRDHGLAFLKKARDLHAIDQIM